MVKEESAFKAALVDKLNEGGANTDGQVLTEFLPLFLAHLDAVFQNMDELQESPGAILHRFERGLGRGELCKSVIQVDVVSER